jgi:GNAT superfamily N-acetyltransferase
MCRLPAPIIAGCGRASPDVCRRWLPTWLPGVSLASLTFERSNGVSNQASGWPVSCSSRAAGCDNRRVQVVVRRARPDDQPVITAMVRRARLNPAGLHWEQFVVGERGGRAVGVAQLRRHSDGTKELASLAVEPGAREHGIGTQMVDALLGAAIRRCGGVRLAACTARGRPVPAVPSGTGPPPFHPPGLAGQPPPARADGTAEEGDRSGRGRSCRNESGDSPAATGPWRSTWLRRAMPQPWPVIRAGGFRRSQAANHPQCQLRTRGVNRRPAARRTRRAAVPNGAPAGAWIG